MNAKKFFIKAIGKRKASIANVYIEKGTGVVLINEKSLISYFSNLTKKEIERIKNILSFVNLVNHVNITAFIKGGGISSQLDAICLALTKALSKINFRFYSIFKKHLLLRSDSRKKERRKYGLKKARKAPQYSKR